MGETMNRSPFMTGALGHKGGKKRRLINVGGRLMTSGGHASALLRTLTVRTSTKDVHMITVMRETCHVCKGSHLEDAFVGPWVVCLDCRQLQSRYTQREERPDETAAKLKHVPRYNLNSDVSELE
jgi:hypothetical protein